ncbi:DUF3159 domain-containing protein [Actinomadura sp. PM05-2]|uniref:DUF3159 domain-containing protein n=1 Tax=Actinomadura parmotrematis TaxID=2864039 RepID=A0ABS7FPR3_9ACTN|nr:DUF3159 domain-containing protein [Actinomadura parmotrematis]
MDDEAARDGAQGAATGADGAAAADAELRAAVREHEEARAESAEESAEEAAHDTVEAAVRAQLTKALGGVRGMVEAAVPTIGFTATYLAAHQVKLAVIVGVAACVVLLAVRLAQRSTPQFALNSLVGIGIAAFFALRSGKAEDAFLPGILLNAGYGVAMIFSILVRWPVVGFIIGSVTGDPTAWRGDPGVVRLCSRLTWLLVLPCVLRVAVQYPIWLAAGDQAGPLGIAKIAMGWPLQVASLAAMVWLLARGRTPMRSRETA